MNDKIMKADYTKPETVTILVEWELGSVICASGDPVFGDPGIADRETEED